MLSRRTILFKPMCAAASGYARLQTENGRTLVQFHARGLPEGGMRIFGYLPERIMRQLGSAQANARGEISLEIGAPAELKALVLLDASPKPLLIGLCHQSGAGDLLDVKNAALALCERLSRPVAKEAPPPEKHEAPPVETVSPAPVSKPAKPLPAPSSLPREIFLPAIDPAPYTSASDKEEAAEETLLPPPKPAGPPVDRLRALRWPRSFEMLREYFESRIPTALLPLPGWRFVPAAQGLWIGREARDGAVRRIAYAYQDAPTGLQERCQPMQGTDGLIYHVLWMDV